MTGGGIYERFAEKGLIEALEDSPVVLVHGPRQCGKTTLAKLVGEKRGYVYLTFDEHVIREAAGSDPTGFIGGLPPRVILDEVQRVPGLFTALKAAVDRRREPGRFLLIGSSNVLLIPHLADSLAGRMDFCGCFRWRKPSSVGGDRHSSMRCSAEHSRRGGLNGS